MAAIYVVRGYWETYTTGHARILNALLPENICSDCWTAHLCLDYPIPLLVAGKVRSARSFDLSTIVATLKRENISDRTIIIAGVAPLLISLLFHVDHLKPILSRIIVDRSKPLWAKCRIFVRDKHTARILYRWYILSVILNMEIHVIYIYKCINFKESLSIKCLGHISKKKMKMYTR